MPRKQQRKASFKSFESISENSKYVRITASMMDGKAWQQLGPYDITVYLHLKRKYRVKSDDTDNSRDISLTYAEMADMMKQGRFTKSVDKLIEVGLIDLVEHRPHTKQPTIYGLSDRWHDYGKEHFLQQERPVLKRPHKADYWERYRQSKQKNTITFKS